MLCSARVAHPLPCTCCIATATPTARQASLQEPRLDRTRLIAAGSSQQGVSPHSQDGGGAAGAAGLQAGASAQGVAGPRSPAVPSPAPDSC